MKLLLVEDEAKISRFIQRGLKEEGFIVDVVSNGDDALWTLKNTCYDLVILDLMLPGAGGYEILRMIRSRSDYLPTIILTAMDSLENKVKGLELGADDYLTKPFAFSELLARIRVQFRKRDGRADDRLMYADLTIDLRTRQVSQGENDICLTPREYALLEFFLRFPEEVLTRTRIAENVWDLHFDPGSNTIDVHVGYLRRKLEITGKRYIETVRGIGYRLINHEKN